LKYTPHAPLQFITITEALRGWDRPGRLLLLKENAAFLFESPAASGISDSTVPKRCPESTGSKFGRKAPAFELETIHQAFVHQDLDYRLWENSRRNPPLKLNLDAFFVTNQPWFVHYEATNSNNLAGNVSTF
jgi:hypothetical protein